MVAMQAPVYVPDYLRPPPSPPIAYPPPPHPMSAPLRSPHTLLVAALALLAAAVMAGPAGWL